MMAALTPEEFAAYSALVEGSTLLQRAVERNLLDQANITQVQFEILMQVGGAPEGLRMSQLADRLIVSRSGLTYQAGLLEKAGFITRQRHDQDERGVVATITPAGIELRDRIVPGHRELVHQAFLDVVTPAELASLTAALGRVAAGLRGSAATRVEP
ncbi:MarR family transcriptional regulator [Glaciihabitans sp. UYNi722]|uniref:MarR family winged helix-turn-helix transcriptional regulator n=1 Tax=Glaciihabitans sp. UYNi722 TaxID=3156344 RepID=UPI003399B8DB